MGKVLSAFGYGTPGTVTRSVDEIVISVRNASDSDIEFGAPVFMTENGAVPFNTDSPQEFADFLGFAVRVADKTPDAYPQGQFNTAASAGETGRILFSGGKIGWQVGAAMEDLPKVLAFELCDISE